MMPVLVVTHVFGCVEIEIIALFHSCTKETEPGVRCLALKPLVSYLKYASQVIQYDANYPCPRGNYRPFDDSQGNTVTLANSDEPYMQQYGEFRGNPESPS